MNKTLTPKQAERFLKSFIAAGRNVHLAGEPGIGKTAIIEKVAKDLNRTLVVKIAAQLGIADITGLPRVTADSTTWILPDWIKQLTSDSIIFFDELPNALPSVWNLLLRMINEHAVGDYRLPPGVVFISAGNRATDRAGSNKLTSSMSSRLVHGHMVADLSAWCQWAVLKNQNQNQMIHPMVLAFNRFRSELHCKFDKDADTFPCPRTWHALSDLIYAGGLDQDLKLQGYCGTVGDAAGVEFMAFERVWLEIPSTDQVLLNPDQAPVPTEPSAMYAISAALASKVDSKNFGRGLKYCKRLPAEFTNLFVKDSTDRDQALAKTAEFTEFQIAREAVRV